MDKYEIVKRIEEFAPLENQESWDVSGWIVETPNKKEVNKILFTLTITTDILRQANEKHCDMIISHHPLFCVPMEYKNIDMYCAHTNLDQAKGGTTDTLIKELGYEIFEKNGFVSIVKLDKPISVADFKNKLIGISPKLRYVNNQNKKQIRTIGFCAGSGSEFINETNTDAFVTGDLKFHTALSTEKVVFDIGHFESEIFAPKLLMQITELESIGEIADEKSPFI